MLFKRLSNFIKQPGIVVFSKHHSQTRRKCIFGNNFHAQVTIHLVCDIVALNSLLVLVFLITCSLITKMYSTVH